jgi:hypothetical protein
MDTNGKLSGSGTLLLNPLNKREITSTLFQVKIQKRRR